MCTKKCIAYDFLVHGCSSCMIHLFLLLNLLSTLVLIRSLLNPLLRFKVTEGETTVKLKDKGVNYNKMENPINEVNGVNFYIN